MTADASLAIEPPIPDRFPDLAGLFEEGGDAWWCWSTYPVDVGDARIPSANAYHGTLSMFERAGFEVVARRQWNDSTPVRPIVRLELSGST
jgi:hypothetical protein